MKAAVLFLPLFGMGSLLNAQVMGNMQYQQRTQIGDYNIDIPWSYEDHAVLEVAGINNVKPDAFVAIFSVKQAGKTQEEVDQLLNQRVNKVIAEIKQAVPDSKSFVDMVSFTPMYEYEAEKKLFSKTTYNEIPSGFQMQKNIHIQYTDPNKLEQIISICARAEIYDLVRVDYFVSDMEAEKRALIDKAKEILAARLKDYEAALGMTMSTLEKDLTDGFKVFYPVERYSSYQAYQSTSLYNQNPAYVNEASKSTTLHYMPVMNKEFDFAINPVVMEPVVQVLYEMKIKISFKPEDKQKPYIWLTPNGQMMEVNPQ